MGRTEGERSLRRSARSEIIILKGIFKNWMRNLIRLRIRTVVGSRECGDEHLDCIKCGYFLD
jgi:hypothetical protein